MSDISVEIMSVEGKKAKKLSLPEPIFGRELNVPLIHQVVVAQQAAARQGTHSTKTRGEVSGGGAKPWRQKGTGRARQGSRRAPQWAGGGIVHGPKPRSYAQRTPKKMIAQALCSALSQRVAEERLFVLESIVSTDVPSTKKALEALQVVGDYASAVVVLHRDEDIAWLSLRNVPNVHALAVDQLNVYDIISNDVIVFTKPALEEFLLRFGVTEIVEEPVKPAKSAKTVTAPTPLEVEEPETDQAETADDTADQGTETEASEELKDYGEGSYRGTNPPEGFDIKGNEDSMKFHTTASPWYKRTHAEVWFNSPEAAKQAGFTDVMEGKK